MTSIAKKDVPLQSKKELFNEKNKRMIQYSVTLIGNPRDPSQPKKAHARIQASDHYDVQRFAEYIASHNSKYSRGDIYAVLDTVARHVKELVQQGNKVSLGDLGAFYPTVNSEPADSIGEFTPNHIRSLRVKWEPPKAFENLLEGIEFHRVVSCRKRKELLKAENEHRAEEQPTESNEPDRVQE